MVRGKRRTYRRCLFTLLCVLMPAVADAAPDNDGAEAQQAQTERETKSYLPPWMQNEGETKTGGAGDKSGAAPEAPEIADDSEAAKKKSTQRTKRRQRNDSFFFPGLFGR